MPITIKCKVKGGFRRCGVRHPEGSTEYPEGTFTAKQIAKLKGEKNLVVEIMTAGPAAKISNGKKKKG